MSDETPRGAILQRDERTYAIVPRTPLGLVTPDDLEKIARVARKHSIPVIKITSGQRMALVGMLPEQVDEVWADLGMDVGPAVELCVHYVQACPGTTLCKFGKGDSLGLGTRLESMLVGSETPAKVKLGISGCPLNCSESFMRDIGAFARKAGWTVVFGGNAGAKPRIGDVVAKGLGEDEVVALVTKLLDHYLANSKGRERTARFVDRVGIESVRAAVL